MRRWAMALLLAFQAIAADAQTAPVPERVAPATVDRARISASPALREAVTARMARWTFRNDCDEAVTSIRLQPEGAADFGPNLLAAPLEPGGSASLARAAGKCRHEIELRFGNGGRDRKSQDLCAEPTLRVREAPPPAVLGTVISKQSPPPPPPIVMPAPVPIPSRPASASRPDPVPREQAAGGGRGPASLPAANPAPAPAPARAPTPPPPPARDEERAAAAAATDPAAEMVESADLAAAEAAPVAEPVVEAPANALMWCPELEEEVPALVCDRVRTVNQGVAGVRAKPEMVLEETQVVRLVVSRSGDAASVVQELGGEDAVYRQFALATGRYMEARLTADSGLEITPTEWVRRDLGAADLEDWEWQVKAVGEGRHRVVLRTRVMKQMPDGQFIPRPGRESEPQFVDVKITRAQDIEQQIGLFTRWIVAISAPAESLTNLLTLLTTLLAAAAGLWAGIRAFGSRAKDPPPPDPES